MESDVPGSRFALAPRSPPLIKRPSTMASSAVVHHYPSASSSPGATTTEMSSRHRKAAPFAMAIAAPRIRRSISRLQQSHRDLRMELFFHIPTLPELQRLRVHRSLSLIALQAMLQREFEVPFEDQQLYFHGDLLEGDEELASYELHDKCVIEVRIRKQYRSIGDIFAKIKVVRFPSKAMHPEDFEIVEVVAALPPLRIVFRRLGIAIAYITMLDRMQRKKSGRRVWRQQVNFWDEPIAPLDTTSFSKGGNPKGKRNTASTRTVLLAVSAQLPEASTSTAKQEQQQAAGNSEAGTSFILRKCSPERVSHLMSMAHAHAIQERLQIPPESRTGADVRHIRKWLCSVKFFASANIPDPAFHEIAKNCVYERYRSGDYIFRQGDVGDFFYILISGCISLAAYGNGFFATMTPGMCFGEISLFEAKGVRTASANVNFAAPFAELAVLSGDVYRRVINPHKQAVLVKTEKAVYSIPQLRCLPDNILTHVAYASKTLTAKTGKRLIRCGDEMDVLVLLVAGEVKISTPRQKQQGSGGNGVSGRFKPPFNQESGSGSIEKPYPIVSVVHAPAVFGQEGCLTNTPKTAPWDIDALDTCTLVCLRMDTISIFLASNQDIIRALVAEHHARVKDFRRRFEQYALLQETRRSSSTVSSNKQASYLRLLSPSRKSLSDSGSAEEGGMKPLPGQRRTMAAQIEFPKVLMKDEPDIVVAATAAPAPAQAMGAPSLYNIRSPRAPSTVSPTAAATTSPRRVSSKTSFRNFFFGSHKTTKAKEQECEQQIQPQSGPQSLPTCAGLQDRFLHLALPHGNMLDLREQIQFVSFEQQQRDWDLQQHQLKQRSCRRPEAENTEEEERVEAKTQALLRGLRKLQAEDVKMVVPVTSTLTHPQWHFALSPSALNT